MEISRPVLNTSQDFGDKPDTNLNESQIVPIDFEIIKDIVKVRESLLSSSNDQDVSASTSQS